MDDYFNENPQSDLDSATVLNLKVLTELPMVTTLWFLNF